MISKSISFFKEAFVELKRVNWPSRQETIKLTIVVVAISIIVAAILGLFDFAFIEALKIIVKSKTGL